MKSIINMWTESKYVLLLKSKRIKCNGFFITRTHIIRFCIAR